MNVATEKIRHSHARIYREFRPEAHEGRKVRTVRRDCELKSVISAESCANNSQILTQPIPDGSVVMNGIGRSRESDISDSGIKVGAGLSARVTGISILDVQPATVPKTTAITFGEGVAELLIIKRELPEGLRLNGTSCFNEEGKGCKYEASEQFQRRRSGCMSEHCTYPF